MTWAARILPALQELVDVLEAAGVPAALERTRVRLPGAFVGPASAAPDTLDGAGRLRAHVLLIAKDTGDQAALESLSGLLDAALTVIDPDEPVDTSLIFPINSNPHPAWRLVVDLDLKE